MAERLFIGNEYSNIEKFQSTCCGVGLSLEPLSKVCCGGCGKAIDVKALMRDYKPIVNPYKRLRKVRKKRRVEERVRWRKRGCHWSPTGWSWWKKGLDEKWHCTCDPCTPPKNKEG